MNRAAGLIACAVLLVASLVLGSPSAAALISAGARSASTAVGSATWGLSPAPAGGGPTGAAYTTSWIDLKTGTDHERLFDLVNVGTLETVGQTIEVRTVRTDGVLSNLDLSLSACVNGAWRKGTCTGTSVELGNNSKGTFTSTVPLRVAPGQRVSLRAIGSAWLWTDFDTTVNVSVNRSQVRSPLKTNR